MGRPESIIQDAKTSLALDKIHGEVAAATSSTLATQHWNKYQIAAPWEALWSSFPVYCYVLFILSQTGDWKYPPGTPLQNWVVGTMNDVWSWTNKVCLLSTSTLTELWLCKAKDFWSKGRGVTTAPQWSLPRLHLAKSTDTETSPSSFLSPHRDFQKYLFHYMQLRCHSSNIYFSVPRFYSMALTDWLRFILV